MRPPVLYTAGRVGVPLPWRNLPLDVVHFLTWHAAHEAHPRGQIVMVAREPGERLPREVTSGLWRWTKRAAEASEVG